MAVPSVGAAIANTYLTTGAGAANNVREDISNIIWKIAPDETPLVTALGRGEPAEAVKTEWLGQDLNAADSNVQPEGWRYVAQPAKKPDRLGNYCQIMVRTVTVSGTLRASDTVGGEDEFDRQTLLKGLEVRRDLEWWITRDKIQTGVDPRQMSGIQTYITNGSMGAGTGAMPAGTGLNAPVHGTPRALSLSLIADAMQQAFTQGGRPTLGLMPPAQKRYFSALAGATGASVAENTITTTAPRPVTIVGAVDAYLTDFGRIEIAPDIFMPVDTALLVDTSHAEIAPLDDRDMETIDMAVTGDAADGAVLFEGTLRVMAPKAHGMVGDLSP